jgi:hypothetical protein
LDTPLHHTPPHAYAQNDYILDACAPKRKSSNDGDHSPDSAAFSGSDEALDSDRDSNMQMNLQSKLNNVDEVAPDANRGGKNSASHTMV